APYEHLGMGLEHVHQNLTAEAVERVKAEDHLRIARQELVQPRLVPDKLLDARQLAQRPGHFSDGTCEAEPPRHGSADRAVPEVQHGFGGKAATAQVRLLGSLHVELVPTETGCEIDLGTEGGEHGLGTAAVHDSDALVTDFEALAEVGNQDLVPLCHARIEGTHMIARSQLHSGYAN